MNPDEWLMLLSNSDNRVARMIADHLLYYEDIILTTLIYELLMLIIDEYDSRLYFNYRNMIRCIGEIVASGLMHGSDLLRNAIVSTFFESYWRVGYRHPNLTHLLGDNLAALIEQYDKEHGCGFE